MNEKTLDEQLSEKRALLEALILEMRHRSVSSEFSVIREEVLRLERKVASARGQPYAEKWEIPEIWGGMTLDCVVLGDQSKCLLVFEAKPASGKFKVLEFPRIAGYKLTDVGDEIIAAHPLAGRGLAAYGTFLIEHSPWLKELEQVDKSHEQTEEERWTKMKHFMLCFKDRIFEALAIEANSAGEADSLEAATSIALARLRSR
jgi:hypothetical protein